MSEDEKRLEELRLEIIEVDDGITELEQELSDERYLLKYLMQQFTSLKHEMEDS